MPLGIDRERLKQDEIGVALDQYTLINPVDALIRKGAGRAWLVLHTRSRQEKAVERGLLAQGAACYLPVKTGIQYVGRRKIQTQVPLFPGYVFLYGHREQAYRADRLRRLVQVIQAPDSEQLTEDLRMIAVAQAAGAALAPIDRLPIGSWAQIMAGPFVGVRGRVEGVGHRQRLILGVGLLGIGAALEIDAGLLAPVDAALALTV